jgi:hypothetical protein
MFILEGAERLVEMKPTVVGFDRIQEGARDVDFVPEDFVFTRSCSARES